jgi:hypothetical protein
LQMHGVRIAFHCKIVGVHLEPRKTRTLVAF